LRDGYSIESGIKKGRPPPDWYINAPELVEGDEIYLSAFWDLSTTRIMGDVIGPIPWTAINQYADVQEFDRQLKLHFIQVIRQMDCEYLEWQRKNRPKAEA
jgi:hypothetical protein